ncbi:MAG: hypothetical protein LBD08_03585, partial [Treponema sp.]|nr:hypothetical protein [Treponema sp.]
PRPRGQAFLFTADETDVPRLTLILFLFICGSQTTVLFTEEEADALDELLTRTTPAVNHALTAA